MRTVALAYPYVNGKILQSKCFNVEVQHWTVRWPEGAPFTGHAGIKISACNGEEFFFDNWWLGGEDQIFGPDEIPDFYEPTPPEIPAPTPKSPRPPTVSEMF